VHIFVTVALFELSVRSLGYIGLPQWKTTDLKHIGRHRCRRRGCRGWSATLKFWFDENPAKILKVRGNLCKRSEFRHKIPENMSKNGAQHALIW